MRIAPDVAQLVFLLDTAFDAPSWHGPNLRGAIRGVTPTLASWRPAAGRHNIWELVAHAGYWKHVAWRRLTGAPRQSGAGGGSNWTPRPQAPGAGAWRADIALLVQAHRTLREAVALLPSSALGRRAAMGSATVQALVTGVAAHDLYHAGQIQLLRRLAPGQSSRQGP